ncbi:MAG: hypothetical protein JWO90_2718 [Solirubrobacterales bacterium]|jgi:plastocyanin|nr:hypothetical protein [Solirubrobacterales bacterium]
MAAGAALTLTLVLVPASSAGTTRTVTIGDNFYSPAKMTVKVGTTVRWRWPQDTGDSHDVKLRSAPKGVRRFHSEEAGSAYSFKRKLTVAGTYRIVCTLHDEMRQTITVKR